MEIGKKIIERINSMKELSVGAGNDVIHMDRSGIWAGAKRFDDAPWGVSTQGVRKGSKVSAYVTAQTLTDTYATILYKNINYDLNSEMNGSGAGVFMAKNSGYYHVSAQLTCNGGADGRQYAILMIKESTQIGVEIFNQSIAGYFTMRIEKDVYLAAGEHLYLQAKTSNTGATIDTAGGNIASFLSIHSI